MNVNQTTWGLLPALPDEVVRVCVDEGDAVGVLEQRLIKAVKQHSQACVLEAISQQHFTRELHGEAAHVDPPRLVCLSAAAVWRLLGSVQVGGRLVRLAVSLGPLRLLTVQRRAGTLHNAFTCCCCCCCLWPTRHRGRERRWHVRGLCR